MTHVREASRRWMYGGKRPNRLAGLLNRGTAAAAAAGIWPRRIAMLEVRGRRSGRRLALPVVIAEYEGERYLVAMLGNEANWVRNVRAAGGSAVLRHGRREVVRLKEVDPAARAPILKRYLQVAPGARAHFPVDRGASLERFGQIAEQYPVFCVSVSAGPAGEEDSS
ncbi:MAG: nitroreductase/quinone reductase family protein [Solirubrobacteraceae bacterium]